MEEDSLIRFTASDATRANVNFYNREHEAHRKHLNACKLRLKRFITEHPEQTFLVYQVPLVVVGSALREAKAILNHMIHSLKIDGFNAAYLGSNLLFISWKSADPDSRTNVKDYVKHAQLGFPSERKKRSSHRGENVVPLTQENLELRGPGPPLLVSDVERTKERLDREIQKRMQNYNERNTDEEARRRKLYHAATSHNDALRNAVNRRVL
tara:strand:- start:3611 stop:4243 length:633 start_codon:yes stop_codon:yes gene_type:complete